MRERVRITLLMLCIAALAVPAVPAGAGESPAYTGPIRRGSEGEAVREWQRALGVTSDGIFGAQTQSATRAWQSARSQSDHGGVGFPSWALMFGNAPGESIDFEGAGFGHGIGLSQYGAQAMASKGGKSADEILGHYYPGATIRDVSQVLPSGHWLLTRSMPLWVGLQSDSSLTIQASAGSLVMCQDIPETLELGSTGPLVRVLEDRLAALGLLPVAADEIFDSVTDAAVRTFQQSQGLAVDGQVGPNTRARLWPMNDIENACAVRTPIASGTAVTVTYAGSGRCSVEGGPAADCSGSVWADRNGALEPLSETHRVSVWGKRYLTGLAQFAHGILRVRQGSGSSLNAVLQVGIEDYVSGIAEVPAAWKTATLEAQAVAARSYALASAINVGPDTFFRSCDCHLYGDARSQVYAGWTREVEYGGAWRAAANATAGKVLSHSTSAIVPAYYSSSNGGRTEDAGEAWGSSRTYLISKDDPWSLDTINPNRLWTRTKSPETVAGVVGLDAVSEVRVISRFSSGAARTVELAGFDDGEAVIRTVAGKALASRLGLPSHYFNVSWTARIVPVPAPAPQPDPLPFDDIAGSTHTDAIVAIFEAGITNGCVEGSFCPNDRVTRGQIASFLSRAAAFPAAQADHFSDDGGSPHEPNINAMYEREITQGCGPGLFCPNDRLKRYEMAVFLVRAVDGLEPGGPDAFVDDNGRWYEPYVNALAASGITLGCGEGLFCPNDTVTRAQMASFLYRAFLEP